MTANTQPVIMLRMGSQICKKPGSWDGWKRAGKRDEVEFNIVGAAPCCCERDLMSEAVHIALDSTPCDRFVRESFICEFCGRFHSLYRERTADDDAYVEFVRKRKAELATTALTESTDQPSTEPANNKGSN